jgi:hypothetical protein
MRDDKKYKQKIDDTLRTINVHPSHSDLTQENSLRAGQGGGAKVAPP